MRLRLTLILLPLIYRVFFRGISTDAEGEDADSRYMWRYLWLIPAVIENVRESGDTSFFDEIIPFADGGEALHVVDVVVGDDDRADAPDVNPGAPAPAGKLTSA